MWPHSPIYRTGLLINITSPGIYLVADIIFEKYIPGSWWQMMQISIFQSFGETKDKDTFRPGTRDLGL